ncbi:hypothetical protein [Loigolactobacillus coryniformis]|uniref:hypothetical protein n=1 Tax=Loigolactobacillus coryniformis TaxID=1610 RepID=UPI001C5CD6F6|nr:hypothetical protein [Loigolactobacillus coryniformis]MBW4802896.1 hypothetical protein [Loigolactobacillus coryniformis subsp. torquens]MBW4805594.1 hypothetical protein [Loigolactobacillus coryniformis subsp. torquens]
MTVLSEKIASLYFVGVEKESGKTASLPKVSLELPEETPLPAGITPNFSILFFRLRKETMYKVNCIITDETNDIYLGNTTLVDTNKLDLDGSILSTNDVGASINIRLPQIVITKAKMTYQLHAELLNEDGSILDMADTYFTIFQN